MIREIRNCRSLLLTLAICCVEWIEARKSNAIFKVVECGRGEAAKIRTAGRPRGSRGAEKDKGLKNVTIDQSETCWVMSIISERVTSYACEHFLYQFFELRI